MTTYLLDRQISSLKEKFVKEGGWTEKMFHQRLIHRQQQSGLGLIRVLTIISALIIAAGGVVVWKKRTAQPTQTQSCKSDNDCPKQMCQPPDQPCAQYYCIQGKCRLVEPSVGKQRPLLPRLEFSFKDCDQFVGAETREKLGTDEVQWLGSTTLLVRALVSINCAEKMGGGDFEIYGNTITLKYQHTKCTECASCECIHELTYQFTNLERKDYQFELSSVRK